MDSITATITTTTYTTTSIAFRTMATTTATIMATLQCIYNYVYDYSFTSTTLLRLQLQFLSDLCVVKKRTAKPAIGETNPVHCNL